MAKIKQDLLVGIIFLAGISLIGVFTIVIKDFSLISGKKGQVVVLFDRKSGVSGLERGHKVLVSGMDVGQVGNLELQEDGTVKVYINLTRPIKLYEGYKMSVKDASALGGKYVDIQVGNPHNGEIALSQKHEGKAQPSLLEDPNLREAFESLKDIADAIKASIEEEEKQGTIALLITRRELYDNILEASENLKDISHQIQNTEGTVGKLLYEKEMADQISETIGNINKVAEDVRIITHQIRSGEGTAGRLVYDQTLYEEATKTLAETGKVMRNLVEITDKIKHGEGTVGKLLTEEEIYNELLLTLKDARKMMQGITQTVDGINNGTGTLATLLNDEQMADNLKMTVADFRVVMSRLKKGEGTVGKLLADESLYKELQKVVKNFSDSLEDTREQVPITTFTNILFKVF